MNPAALLRGIRDGDSHAGGIRCLRLFRVEPAYFLELSTDVERLCRQECPSDVSQPGHVTSWAGPFGCVLQWSLLNASGRYDDFSGDHDLSCLGKRFHQPDIYPALARFIAAFPHTVNFRLNLLGPHAGLTPHEERAVIRTRAGTVGARVRFHLPVVTTTRAELVLDGHVYHLEQGTVYFINHGCVHSATNEGADARLHLVWDMLLTREAFNCMFGNSRPLAVPLQRCPPEESTPAPVRIERVRPTPRRLPPMVLGDQMLELGFCDVQ